MNPQFAKDWLSQHAMPLWLERGVDRQNGGFPENLSMHGDLLASHRRCMVQARQIFSFRTAVDLGVVEADAGRSAVASGAKFLLERYSLPSGAFRHSVSDSGQPISDIPDLYGQAFALFGLAHAFSITGDSSFAVRARALVKYLREERRAPGGGFTEYESGRVVFRSNPHMHLFEASVAWMAADKDPLWRSLAEEVLELCLAKFIDQETGALAENFLEGWEIERQNDLFIYEPGHLCEWSWLMGGYQEITGEELMPTRQRLFQLSESTGKDPTRKSLYDQMWSDLSPKLKSSRFWPQCERVKAASQLGLAKAAHEGMAALFRYFDLPVRGLWFDTWEENGNFREQPVKSSSLYHIIGAISEYQRLA